MPRVISDLATRACPVCGGKGAVPFAAGTLRPQELTAFAYAARKDPEFMSHRLVECLGCGLVFADLPLSAELLASAYASAAFDSGEEANCAAKTYATCLSDAVRVINPKRAAIDVGAGNGALLPLLSAAGFSPVVGIEPSHAAIQAADASARPQLRNGVFSRQLVEDLSPSLICAFMTLEHMPDPLAFFHAAFELLEPGGTLAVVVHNRRGWLNRMLGLRSPIIDLEHLQLFDPRSLRHLYDRAGFRGVNMNSFCNTYPLRYWLRLTPLPPRTKQWLIRIARGLRCERYRCSFPVGNLFATGAKPRSA